MVYYAWAGFSLTWKAYLIEVRIDMSEAAQNTTSTECIKLLANAMGDKLRTKCTIDIRKRRES
jgi:hypothetical protein